MNELQLVKALEPYIDELLAAIKRIDEVEARQPVKGDPGESPSVEAILERLKADPRFKGEPGEAPTADDIVNILKADETFVAVLTPEAPAPLAAPSVGEIVAELLEKHLDVLKGTDGKAPTIEEVAASLMAQFGAELKGEPGDTPDVDPQLVAQALVCNEEFVAKLDTLKGKDADPIDPVEVAKSLLDIPAFVELVTPAEPLKGDPGDAADPAAVAAVLKADTDFVASLQGDPGESPIVEDVVKALMALPEFVEMATPAEPLKGDPGDAADPAEVAAALKADALFVESLKGEKGDTLDPLPALIPENGKDGADGAGILAEEHIEGKVYREGRVVTAFIGQYYRAKCDTAEAPGDSDDWARIGTAGFRWRGLKPEEKSLKLGDLFIDGGSLFGMLTEKASMIVQRPKAAPVVKSIAAKDGNLVLRLSDGSEVVGEMPVAKGYTLSTEQLEEKILVLDEALKVSEGKIAKLLARLERIEKHLSEDVE
jgi:hypothetical protein